MTSPDAFFDKKTGFRVKKMAKHVAPGLGIGPDGDFWKYDGGVFRPAPDEVRNRMAEALGDRYRSSMVQSVVDMLQAFPMPRIPDSPELGSWFPWINLKNGMYNWKTREFRGHDASLLSTVQLPVEYIAFSECPKFNAWVDEVVPGDMVDMFWEFLGYMLMTGNPLQLAFLLHGPGGTGKSTALRVLERLLGRENITAQSLKALTENRFAPASLFMKQANILGDIDAGFMRDSSLFKNITGGDTFTAERKYRDGFEFRPFAVPVFSANKTWKSMDDSDGYFRRWVILPFTQKVDRSKPFNERDLFAELPGIMRKALDALIDLHERGHFDVRGSAYQASQEFQEESDHMQFWLADDPLITHEQGNDVLRVSKPDLYARYVVWAEGPQGAGYKAKKKDEFYKSMKAKGFRELKSGNYRYFLGISVLYPVGVPA